MVNKSALGQAGLAFRLTRGRFWACDAKLVTSLVGFDIDYSLFLFLRKN